MGEAVFENLSSVMVEAGNSRCMLNNRFIVIFICSEASCYLMELQTV